METRRQFALKLFITAVSFGFTRCSRENSFDSPTSPNVPQPSNPVNALAHPVRLDLAGQFVGEIRSRINGNLQDALSAEGWSPASSESYFRNPNGSTSRDYLIHTLKGVRPLRGYDFMINDGHYFSAAYNFPVRTGDKIAIYMPPEWDGVTE